jgi:hypothetical protein
MKQYISAILIPCLLLQLCGCYSYREITLEELKNYKGGNDIKIMTDKDTILISRDLTKSPTIDWLISDSSIIVQDKSILDGSNTESVIQTKNEIKFQQIKTVAINEPDSEETEGLILLAVIFVAAATAIIIAVANENFIKWEY